MREKLVIILCFLIAIFTLTGCSEKLYLNDNTDEKYDSLQVIPDQSKTEKLQTSLYFAMEKEDFMLPELREVSYSSTQIKEYAIVQELINGTKSAGMTNLINGNTKILSITTNNDYIYVSLSKEIMDVPESLTVGWENDPQRAQNVYKQRRMAIYTLVNTLTQNAEYARVQLYVDMDADGTADRITRRQAGFIGDGNDALALEALPRNHDYILTPVNTVKLAMNLISGNQTDRLYDLVSPDIDTGEKIPAAEFAAQFTASKSVLNSYAVSGDASFSNYGVTAVVLVDYNIKMGTVTSDHSAVPVLLYRHGNRYYIDSGFIEYVLKG